MIALDDFRFAIAIHIGQYASFDTGQLHYYVLLNWLNRDNVALFLPKAGHAFLIVAALQWFSLTSSTTIKNHTKEKM